MDHTTINTLNWILNHVKEPSSLCFSTIHSQTLNSFTARITLFIKSDLGFLVIKEQEWSRPLNSKPLLVKMSCKDLCKGMCHRTSHLPLLATLSGVIKWVVNSYSASHGNWCTATLWNRIITTQCEGMGEVGLARYEPALLPPCPSIRVLSCSNCQRSTHSSSRAWQCKCY